MNGRVLDALLIAIWVVAFFIVAMVHPGVTNLIIGWGGAVGLLWYNSLVRHDPKDDSVRAPWRRRKPVVG